MLNRWLRSGTAIAALSLIALLPATACAIGYFNLPGNWLQWHGYGNGPGYHAPMMLGPVSHRGLFYHGVDRLPYAPCPPHVGCGCGYGNSDYGVNFGEPSLLEPTVEPIPAPGRAPEPMPGPAAFRAPFRY